MCSIASKREKLNIPIEAMASLVNFTSEDYRAFENDLEHADTYLTMRVCNILGLNINKLWDYEKEGDRHNIIRDLEDDITTLESFISLLTLVTNGVREYLFNNQELVDSGLNSVISMQYDAVVSIRNKYESLIAGGACR